MIVWINGPFGGEKTTLSELLVELIPNSIIFDPERVGFIIHGAMPEERSRNFQDFKMWRKLVVEFIREFQAEFKKNLVIPMAIHNLSYTKEIFSEIKNIDKDYQLSANSFFQKSAKY